MTETPVQSDFGWHIIKVEERFVGPAPFEEVRDDISQSLMRQKLDAILDELRKTHPVEIIEQAQAEPAAEEPSESAGAPEGAQTPAASETSGNGQSKAPDGGEQPGSSNSSTPQPQN
jgi:peptidyl-prolyl cis-trans isomerase C